MARATKKSPSAESAEVSEDAATPGIDAILDGLEGVVKQLEEGDLPLERALERFEEGVRLARRGSELLDAVEERVEMLLADRDEAVPLRRGRDEDDDA
jgi:exodeoxyribonuclease VII small subunit